VNMDGVLRLFLLEACNAHGSDMALAYEKGRCKKAKKEFTMKAKEAAEDQWAFIEIAADSSVPDENIKKSILTELNLPQYFDDLEEVVKNYRHVVFGTEMEKVSVLSKQDFETGLSAYIASTSS
jgi:hypothetical protein